MAPGEVVSLSGLVRRVLAPNPSVMTGPGTNSYLIGDSQIAVIDPGPPDEDHLDRLAEAGNGRIRWILVTHTHPDHSPGADGLKVRTGAEVLGFSARDGFAPDTVIGDGYELAGPDFCLTALHTPGHAANHLCYLLDPTRWLFSGDHVMSGSTVVIAPPDGDMAAYLQALGRVADLHPPVSGMAPGHGPFIDDPAAAVSDYLTHRRARESAIADALARIGPATVEQLVEAVYTDVAPVLHPIARFSVWAHLRKLAQEGRAKASNVDDVASIWVSDTDRWTGTRR
ncbi:MAG: MBL fold metallo-hydrolase [Acidimicrobiales bacterium]